MRKKKVRKLQFKMQDDEWEDEFAQDSLIQNELNSVTHIFDKDSRKVSEMFQTPLKRSRFI